ncbi:hypothetical protein TrVFT333_010283 [Trichoderma virens FT-333]|nr:hypothetical protein TrVFT333_010283 [Trichoderma virens FT-333]
MATHPNNYRRYLRTTTELEPPSEASIPIEDQRSVSGLGHPLTDYVLAVVASPDNVKFTSHTVEPPYHDKGKAILCINNFAAQDQMFGKPDRLFWSDLMAACFSQTMTASDCDTNGLEAIWRINIVNQGTINVINTYCKGQAVVLGIKNDGFYALLATGPARMLATYPHMFGSRFMAEVTSFDIRKAASIHASAGN